MKPKKTQMLSVGTVVDDGDDTRTAQKAPLQIVECFRDKSTVNIDVFSCRPKSAYLPSLFALGSPKKT